MDHVGPMTRSVEDAAIMFEAMAGLDAERAGDAVAFETPGGLNGAQVKRRAAGDAIASFG
jgi:Asp-tRNA(Asn)/Glu-tRNA(Gln) amidotransferase A subunit family amidase